MDVDLGVDVVVDDLARIYVGDSRIRRLIAADPNACVHDQDRVYVHVHDMTA